MQAMKITLKMSFRIMIKVRFKYNKYPCCNRRFIIEKTEYVINNWVRKEKCNIKNLRFEIEMQWSWLED